MSHRPEACAPSDPLALPSATPGIEISPFNPDPPSSLHNHTSRLSDSYPPFVPPTSSSNAINISPITSPLTSSTIWASPPARPVSSACDIESVPTVEEELLKEAAGVQDALYPFAFPTTPSATEIAKEGNNKTACHLNSLNNNDIDTLNNGNATDMDRAVGDEVTNTTSKPEVSDTVTSPEEAAEEEEAVGEDSEDEFFKHASFSRSMNVTGLVYDERMCDHYDPAGDHPERPERISSIFDKLVNSGLADLCQSVEPRCATNEELECVHTQGHIHNMTSLENGYDNEQLMAISRAYNSIYFNTDSHLSARVSAGSLMSLVEEV